MGEVVNVTIACDTRVARLLLNTLAPLVRDGVITESDLREIVSRAISVIYATFTPKATDGGKARILARRFEDLTMDHADPCNTPSDSAHPSA